MDIDEFCPSPDRAAIDKTCQARPDETTFQVSSQSEFVCSRYRQKEMDDIA